MSHIVKRKGHKQPYDQKKAYASVYAACLSSHVQQEEAETIAQKMTDYLNEWIKEKEEVNSREIFEEVEKELKHLNKEAAFMYKTHRDVS